MCKKLYMFIKTNKIYRTRMMLQLMLIVKIWINLLFILNQGLISAKVADNLVWSHTNKQFICKIWY
jgi:hypothetical protein